MKRIMIIDSDPVFTKELTDFFNVAGGYEIVGNATDGETAFELIPKLNPEVIIIDLILPRRDGCSIIKHYRGDSKIKTIALSSLNNAEFVSKALDLGASCFMLKPLSLSNLKENIDELFAAENDKSFTNDNLNTCKTRNLLDEKITDIFIQIGIPANIKGYLFLKEAIKISMNNLEIVNSLTKKLYPEIAEHFNTNSCRVERSIRHAIEVAWNRGRLVNLNSIFGLYVYSNNDKPSNGELIAFLAEKLILESAYDYQRISKLS